MELGRYRAGSGEPLVLLHGIWESWHSWSPVLDRLAAEREVLAPTLPDHLGSPPLSAGAAPTVETWADAVEAELDDAGFERPDIAGNSLGGWLALELAKARASANGRGGRPRRHVHARRMAGLRKEGSARPPHDQDAQAGCASARSRPSGKTPAAGRQLRLPGRIPPVEAERLLAQFAHCDVAAQLAANTTADGGIARIEGLERVSCPVLLLHPSGDRLFSREHAERFLAELPDAEFRELTGCGHTAMFDDPELVASEILRFTSTSS